MKLYRGLGALPKNLAPSALTIGNFDAVHRGHRALIERVNLRAKSEGAIPTLVTFNPHPQKVLHGQAPPALVRPEDKLELLQSAGIKRVLEIPFTKKLSMLEPEDFIQLYLLQGLRARVVVVGAGFRFGRLARGDVPMLRSFSRTLGFVFEAVRLAETNGRRISSTAIRHALAEGDLEWANKALGRAYKLPGKIVRGVGRGRRLGYPTANLKPHAGLVVPGPGVYAGSVAIGKRTFTAAISIGTNPTFGAGPLSVEALLIDYTGNLYGRAVEFEFAARIRDHVAFDGPNSLREAIAQDVKIVRRLASGASPALPIR